LRISSSRSRPAASAASSRSGTISGGSETICALPSTIRVSFANAFRLSFDRAFAIVFSAALASFLFTWIPS
jgi:hypothetical protein